MKKASILILFISALFAIGLFSKVFSRGKKIKESNWLENDISDILSTSEAKKVRQSEEFKNLLFTKEFIKFATDYGTDRDRKSVV